MKRKYEHASVKRIRRLKNVILSAIGELDLRGTNDDISNAMAIVEIACDSAMKNQQVQFRQLYQKGLELERNSI
jgi:hypothetical protein